MPQFCDVALPVPLETCFTYRLNGAEPVVGGRVLVPFRNLRLPGVVTALHDRAPSVEAKHVLEILDAAPVLDPELMRLGEWISHYYLAPLGEVFRTMLPLGAEVKRARAFRITEAGWTALHESAERGSSRRSKKSADEQMLEYRVLDYLAARDGAREQTLRTALRAGRELLAGLVRKGWITAEDVSSARDARRTRRVVQLKEVSGKLNANQQRIVETLAAAGGRAPMEHLRSLEVPQTTLATLARRGIVDILKEPAEFAVSRLEGKPALDFPLNPAQTAALEQIRKRVEEKRFSVTLLLGVTGSGKTAVYLAAMQYVLAAGRSAILLVPEIGLTPRPPPTCTTSSATRSRSCTPRSAMPSGPSSGTASAAAKRASSWARVRRSLRPVRDLALIIVDEEHDQLLQAGRDAALSRPRRCRDARQGAATPRWCWARPRRRWSASTTPHAAATRSSNCPDASSSVRCRKSNWWTCAPSSSRPARRACSPAN